MKASEIKYQDIFLKSTQSTIEDLVYLKEEPFNKEKSDIGIVFGGLSMIPNRLNEAIELYQEELIQKILVTGGIGKLSLDRKTPEAFKMLEYLKGNHIPKQDILIEPEASNSHENIKYSLKLIKEKYNLEKTKLTLITSDYHMKRCIGMMLKETKKENVYIKNAKNGMTDLENWKNTSFGKRVIYQEALLLCYYARHKRILDFDTELIRNRSK